MRAAAEGAAARRDGRGLDWANPYQRGSAEFYLWRAGWETGTRPAKPARATAGADARQGLRERARSYAEKRWGHRAWDGIIAIRRGGYHAGHTDAVRRDEVIAHLRDEHSVLQPSFPEIAAALGMSHTTAVNAYWRQKTSSGQPVKHAGKLDSRDMVVA